MGSLWRGEMWETSNHPESWRTTKGRAKRGRDGQKRHLIDLTGKEGGMLCALSTKGGAMKCPRGS